MKQVTYKKINLLLMNVVGKVQEMNDDSNLFVDDLEKLTNLIRANGATDNQMNKLIGLGQQMINLTDEAEFMDAYKSGAKFEKYVNELLPKLN